MSQEEKFTAKTARANRKTELEQVISCIKEEVKEMEEDDDNCDFGTIEWFDTLSEATITELKNRGFGVRKGSFSRFGGQYRKDGYEISW